MKQPEKNKFGGFWTEQKVGIFLKYLKAYLDIMNKRYFQLIYFDGFAGSGSVEIKQEDAKSLINSVAIEVIGLQHPAQFTYYYLVEKNEKKAEKLREEIKEKHPEIPGIHVVHSDCNEKLAGMASYMQQKPNSRALCFIDPFGMTVNWESITKFQDLGVDMWLLVPTGIGVNRLLTKNGKIEESWLLKLESFLGLGREQIILEFYKQRRELTLFGEEDIMEKQSNAIAKIMELYKNQLETVFKFVSTPFPMKNSMGATMYHFVLATNNKTALKIGNDIIGKELSIS
jgi:three-Cys-motif partner protein